MSAHNIMILRCHNKKTPTIQFYVSLSPEEPNLEMDEFWNRVSPFIQHQDSDPQQTSIFGIVEEVVQHWCDLPLSDRMNGIHFKPAFHDEEWFGADSVYPIISDQAIPAGHLYARHVLVPK